MTLEKAAKKINESFPVLLTAVLVLVVLVPVSELLFGLFSRMDPSAVFSAALELGGAGALLAFIALLFYPLRKAGIRLKDRFRFLGSGFYRSLMKITALLHPVIALLAFLLLFLHGFFILGVIYRFAVDRTVFLGILALSALTVLLASGSVLKKKLTRKQLRIFHFSAACLFLLLFLLHRFLG